MKDVEVILESLRMSRVTRENRKRFRVNTRTPPRMRDSPLVIAKCHLFLWK
jgi:hypothetical protein